MTAECIESVFEKTKNVEFEIILVDNASTDGSKELFECDSRIKYIYSQKNLGFGQGNNLGYKYATGDYIFLLNSDTLLANNAVKIFFDYMQNSPNSVGCAGCVLQNKKGEIIHSYHIDFPTLSWFFQEVICYAVPKLWNPYKRDCKRALDDKCPLVVKQITGADMFIRRIVIEQCGMFDPDFFMYYEETEMQHRFFEKGFLSMVIDTPKIIHLVGASSKQSGSHKPNFLRKYNRVLKGRFTYAKKIFFGFEYLLFRLMHFLMIPRVIFSKSTMLDKKETISILLGR